MAPMRNLLVYGNCQAGWLANAMGQTRAVAAEYRVIYLTDYSEIPANHPSLQPGFWGTIDIVVCQTAAGCRPPEFLAALPPSSRIVRFPTLWLKALWPMYMVDPRNQPEPALPWGRFPYGDRLALKLLAQGVKPAALSEHYINTDLNKVVNLDRFMELMVAELTHNDRKSDVAITPYILANYQARKIFGTVNHPTLSILHFIYLGVLAALFGTLPADRLPEPEHGADVDGNEEIPLHPQIIQHFRLAWAAPNMRWRYRSAFLNLAEYLEAYGEFRAIPAGNPPVLFLGRAQQAAALGDFADARRLLLQATIRFPETSAFLHYLAVLLLRRGDLLETEKVTRLAISRFPDDARLHRLLGDTLQRAGFAQEAQKSYLNAQSVALLREDAPAA